MRWYVSGITGDLWAHFEADRMPAFAKRTYLMILIGLNSKNKYRFNGTCVKPNPEPVHDAPISVSREGATRPPAELLWGQIAALPSEPERRDL